MPWIDSLVWNPSVYVGGNPMFLKIINASLFMLFTDTKSYFSPKSPASVTCECSQTYSGCVQQPVYFYSVFPSWMRPFSLTLWTLSIGQVKFFKQGHLGNYCGGLPNAYCCLWDFGNVLGTLCHWAE